MAYAVRAHNTAVDSSNRMHADDTARTYGFRGGLVPGVDVYAYMTNPLVTAWGLAWLDRGTMSARFLHPVYDGDEVVVTGAPLVGAVDASLELRDPTGELCASATASLPPVDAERPAVHSVPRGALPSARPRASATSLAPGRVLGSLVAGFHADRADAYLGDVRERSPLYRDERVAHPGWLLRFANSILVANVELGPWIHVSSDVTHHAVVHDGQRVETRARVIDEYERKGHRFVELDVLLVADGTTSAMRSHHTAIYEPRRNED